jgi:hypothetical protein
MTVDVNRRNPCSIAGENAMLKFRVLWIVLSAAMVISHARLPELTAAEIAHLQGEMAGEVSTTSVILQSRLTAAKIDADGDGPRASPVSKSPRTPSSAAQ